MNKYQIEYTFKMYHDVTPLFERDFWLFCDKNSVECQMKVTRPYWIFGRDKIIMTLIGDADKIEIIEEELQRLLKWDI